MKFETNKFIKVICAYAEENEVEIQQTDTDFYRVLAKHILFFKYILTAYVFCKTFLHNIAKKKYTPLRLKFFSDYCGFDRAFLSR